MTTNNKPDQSTKVVAAITDALFMSTDTISHGTARLIAAALHQGPGTALERLAATGRFDPETLQREIEALAANREHEAWRQALLVYVEGVRRRTHPWVRGSVRRRPTADQARERG